MLILFILKSFEEKLIDLIEKINVSSLFGKLSLFFGKGFFISIIAGPFLSSIKGFQSAVYGSFTSLSLKYVVIVPDNLYVGNSAQDGIANIIRHMVRSIIFIPKTLPPNPSPVNTSSKIFW